MSEAGLISFQVSEILDSLKLLVFMTLLVLGILIWAHATFFRRGK